MSYLWPFLMTNVLFTLHALSSANFLVLWFNMELSSVVFCCLLTNNKTILSKISAWKYLLIQSLGSTLFLLGMVLGPSIGDSAETMILLGMIIKIGLIPFMGWLMQACENLDWWKIQWMGTVQKLVPLIVLTNTNSWGLSLISVLASVIACIVLFSSSSVRWVVIVSSSLNFSWMLNGIVGSNFVVTLYYSVYTYSHFLLFVIMEKQNTQDFKLHYAEHSPSVNLGLGGALVILSLAGMPPFPLFMTKLEIIYSLSEINSLLSPLILATSSMVFISAYLHLFFPYLLSFASPMSQVNNKLSSLSSAVLLSLVVYPTWILF